jgi:iron(III) transport system substrate-binding protein
MSSIRFQQSIAALVVGGFATVALAGPVQGADLPKSLQKMLKELNVSADLLKNIDKELAIPQAMLDAANKEGKVRIGATHDPKQFRNFVRPFQERYPKIKISYARANRYDRVIKPLIALKSGKVVVDIISGFGGQSGQFRKLDALADLSILPAYKGIAKVLKSPHNQIAPQRLLFRCLTYNTDKVKKAELPKTWDDILTSKRWRGKQLAMVNRADYWALHLWNSKGENWTRNYMTNLFLKVKPQLRKEGANAAMALAGAGEYDGLLAGTAHRTATLLQKGTPIGLHCMDIVPSSVSPVGALKASPNINAALVWINWFISREGQLAQFASARYTPIYADLRKAGLEPMPGLTKGKKVVYWREDQWQAERESMISHWDALWFQRKGLKIRTVKAKIDAVKRGGRRFHFKVAGKDQKVRVSSSRTLITINGTRTGRKGVKKGMSCSITYPGHDQTAKSVICTK